MLPHSPYQSARAVATIVENHFAHYLALARQHGEQKLAPAPDAGRIEAILDTAFWASLQREEGLFPKISLVLLPPEQARQPILFLQRLPLTPGNLAKLAPGVERPGIHLGIWYEGNDLYLWGVTKDIPSLCFVLDISQPGLLVIKHRRIDGFGKYTNVAVLQGDKIKVIDFDKVSLPNGPALLTSFFDFLFPSKNHSVNVLVQLAASMRAHGRGGSMLVVPSGAHRWHNSIVHPTSYSIEPAYYGLTDLMQQVSDKNESLWQAALRREVESLAGFTAVDGAIIISERYELLAFGAKIKRAQGKTSVEQMLMSEPIVGDEATIIHPSQLGGTRHLSAAQFVHDQQDALALIASQDGRFTIFAWSSSQQMVHAHRVDSLLL